MTGLRTQFCGVIMRRLLVGTAFRRLAGLVAAMVGLVAAARFYGEDGISAVVLTLPMVALGLLLGVLNAAGANRRCIREPGPGDGEEACRQYGQGVIFSVAAGLVLALVCYLGRDAYYEFTGVSDKLYPLFYEYWQYLLLPVAVEPLLALLRTAVYNDDDPRTCNAALAVQLVGNLILPFWFCSLMGMGGISLGMACSSLLALPVCLLHFLRPGNTIHFRRHFKWRDFLRNARFNLNDALPLLCFGLFSLILAKFIVGTYGEAYLPVLGVVVFLLAVCVLTDAVGRAVQPVIGSYRGEDNNAGIRKAMRLGAKLAVAAGVAGAALFPACAGFLPAAFNIGHPDIAAAVVAAARILTPVPLACSLLFLYIPYYQELERVRLGLGIILACDLVFGLALPLGLGTAFGLNGLWVGVALAPVVTLVLAAGCVLARHGRKKFPLLLERDGLNVLSHDLVLGTESILTLQRHVEEFLKLHHVGTETKFKVLMLVEELYMLTMEKNPGRRIVAECTIFTGKEITLVSRDTGIVFDVTDADSPVSSFRSFVVSSMMELHPRRQYRPAAGLNRQIFRFPAV